VPVTYDAAAEHKNATTPPISFGVPSVELHSQIADHGFNRRLTSADQLAIRHGEAAIQPADGDDLSPACMPGLRRETNVAKLPGDRPHGSLHLLSAGNADRLMQASGGVGDEAVDTAKMRQAGIGEPDQPRTVIQDDVMAGRKRKRDRRAGAGAGAGAGADADAAAAATDECGRSF
jgi:hypothetical protein